MDRQRVEVLFGDNAEIFDVSRSSISYVVELKRQIYERMGILPIEQRLSLVGDIDEFSFPPKLRCVRRQNRNPMYPIKIEGYNQDIFTVQTDPRDHVLDLKFLLSPAVGEEPQNIRLLLNGRMLKDTENIGRSGCMNPDSRIFVWFEYPSMKRGHGTIHRSVPRLMDIDPSAPTVGQLVRTCCQQFGDRRFMGTRSFRSDGTRGRFRWIKYSEANDRISRIAAGFLKIGINTRDRVGLFSKNRVEWQLCDFACQTQSMISVPLYSTLGPNVVEYITNHAELKAVVVDKDTLPQVVAVIDSCPSLKFIILMDDQAPDQQLVASQGKSSGYTHSLSEIESLGSTSRVADNFPNADDIFTLCYTSGTTGNPKGVMLTHRNILSAVAGIGTRTPDEYLEGEADAILSYLPLAHIYERIAELLVVKHGVRIGYFQGDTKLLGEDIAELKPTVLAGVPRVFQTIHDKVFAEVGKSNSIRQFLFNQAYAAKKSALEQGLQPPWLWERLVFSRVKSRFGGVMKGLMSGSAPLSPTTAMFMRICMADKIGEGYGLTETAAGGTSTHIDDEKFGHVGTPIPCCEIKLVDVTEMEYCTTDLPCPRGEIWIRGPNVFVGYYKDQEKTSAVMEDGWFATGDIGMWREDGKLQIIDRKKNIFKLAQGEYIRPEYIENIYKQSAFIANMFVHGDSNQTYLVAIVAPDFEVLENWANVNGHRDIAQDASKLISLPIVRELIAKDMMMLEEREKLIGFERVRNFALVDEDFSPENGLLTDTMKLKRHYARKVFENKLDELYRENGPKKASSKL